MSEDITGNLTTTDNKTKLSSEDGFIIHTRPNVGNGEVTITEPLPVQIYEPTSGRALEFDNMFRAIMTVSPDHHQIHEGNNYFWSFEFSLGVNGTKEYIVVTPNSSTKLSHFNFENIVKKTDSETLVEVFRDVITTDDGTSVDVLNSNDDSSNTNDTVIAEDPTITSDGTLYWFAIAGSGVTGGGNLGISDEHILKGSATKYLIRITSRGAGNDIQGNPSWYEQDSTE